MYFLAYYFVIDSKAINGFGDCCISHIIALLWSNIIKWKWRKYFAKKHFSVGKMLLIPKYLLAINYYIIININIKMVNNVYCLHTSESELGAFTASHSQCNLKNLIGNQTVIYLTHYWERTKRKLNIIWLSRVHIADTKQWIIWALSWFSLCYKHI